MEFSFNRVLLIAEIKEIRKSEKGPPTTLPQQGSCERYFQQQIMILGGGETVLSNKSYRLGQNVRDLAKAVTTSYHLAIYK